MAHTRLCRLPDSQEAARLIFPGQSYLMVAFLQRPEWTHSHPRFFRCCVKLAAETGLLSLCATVCGRVADSRPPVRPHSAGAGGPRGPVSGSPASEKALDYIGENMRVVSHMRSTIQYCMEGLHLCSQEKSTYISVESLP